MMIPTSNIRPTDDEIRFDPPELWRKRLNSEAHCVHAVPKLIRITYVIKVTRRNVREGINVVQASL